MKHTVSLLLLTFAFVDVLCAEWVSPIKLPIEVVGLDGTSVTVPFDIPATTDVKQATTIALQIHNLKYQSEASLRINDGAWMPINDSTVTLLGNAKAYGGIGGGFHTLKLTMTLPGGVLTAGTANRATFRFNGTDGFSSGFRVLAFNIVARSGASLIDPARFTWDDVTKWQPPSRSPTDLAAGKRLWQTASLETGMAGLRTKIRAHCSDCHTEDGSDLKYFNYSNTSIRARSMFHGLTSQQGDQIASYIRTLNMPNPGQPWNPPYQPGPGLDSQPVMNWSAGAGIDAVLDSDRSMLGAMFPNGFPDAAFAANSRLNQRETPQPFEYPDWNDWLPRTHPMDAFGVDFTSSTYNTIYSTLRSKLSVGDAGVYAAQRANFDAWNLGYYNLYLKEGGPVWANSALWTPSMAVSMMSLPKWGLVKEWELMHDFQLEDLSKSILGPQADARGWYSPMPFSVAPHMLKMPAAIPGEGNGTEKYYIYFSNIWYNLQLILNAGQGQDHQPVDWSYEQGFIKDLGGLSAPQAGLQTLWLIKGLQISREAGTTPQQGRNGWQPFGVNQISLLVTPEWNQRVWKGVPLATRIPIYQGYLKAWLAEVNRFTPQQFYSGGWTTQAAVPVRGGDPYSASLPDAIWYSIPRFKFLGVDPALVAQWADWAQTIWPNANWTTALNATCKWTAAGSTDVTCSP